MSFKLDSNRFISEDTYKGDMWNPQSQNGYVYVWNNPLRYVDPSGHWIDGVDDSIWRLLNKQQRSDIIDNGRYFEIAKANNDVDLMQYYHDASNAIRFNFMDSVTRVDFINGGTTTLYKTPSGGIGDSKSGLEAVPYVKGQVGISIIGTASLQAKIQNHELSVSFIRGLNGELSAQLTASTDVSISNGGDMEYYTKKGVSRGLFYYVESEVAKDLQDVDAEAIFGGGIGLRGSIS